MLVDILNITANDLFFPMECMSYLLFASRNPASFVLLNLSILRNPEIVRLDSDKAKTFRFVDKDKSIGPEEMMQALIHG
jgi:hypothetical protein